MPVKMVHALKYTLCMSVNVWKWGSLHPLCDKQETTDAVLCRNSSTAIHNDHYSLTAFTRSTILFSFLSCFISITPSIISSATLLWTPLVPSRDVFQPQPYRQPSRELQCLWASEPPPAPWRGSHEHNPCRLQSLPRRCWPRQGECRQYDSGN